jgi:glucose/arabinose dehydrogenase
MLPGAHILHVAATSVSGQAGPLSNPVRVQYEPLWALGQSGDPRSAVQTTSDDVTMIAEVMASGLADATDLAVLPDARVLIAQRGGRVRMFRDGRLLPEAAASIPGVATGDGRGLLTIAPDIEFEKTSAVFVLHSTADGARLARFTLAGNVVADHATILDGLPLARRDPAAALTVGHDRLLYLALDDGGDREHVDDLGSYRGKVLRLRRDGTVPSDAAAFSPVFAQGLARPRGLAWLPGWDGVVLGGRDADGVPSVQALLRLSRREVVRQPREVPSSVDIADVVVHDSPSIGPLVGDLLLASAAGGILRMQARQLPAPQSEWLFRGWTGPLRALAVSSEGAIYAITETELIAIRVESK